MERKHFQSDGLRLYYWDSGGEGPAVVALHSHWMEGKTYLPLAEALGSSWRLLALDQRGHGDSDHAASYRREDYERDLEALLKHAGVNAAVFLGNSLGGANAYRFAARHPRQVLALIIEDIGVVIHDDTSFALPWAGNYNSVEALEERIGPRLTPYLKESFREVGGHWRLAFEPADMVQSQTYLNGDHWDEWLSSTCPALVLRGLESRVTSADHLQEMAQRRPDTTFITLNGGHVLHVDNPVEFARAVSGFLLSLDLQASSQRL